MNQDQNRKDHNPQQQLPSQAEVYENLRRIGELEDKKQAIQDEIEQRTDRLKESIGHVDRDSLLYKMLTSVVGRPGKRSVALRRSKKTPTGSTKNKKVKTHARRKRKK